MSINNKNIIFFSSYNYHFDFLEFIAFNLNIINERTDLRINTLTIKEYFHYICYFFIFMIAFFKKKIKTFDALVYLIFILDNF